MLENQTITGPKDKQVAGIAARLLVNHGSARVAASYARGKMIRARRLGREGVWADVVRVLGGGK